MIYEDLHKTLSAGSRTASAKMGSAMHPVESLDSRVEAGFSEEWSQKVDERALLPT